MDKIDPLPHRRAPDNPQGKLVLLRHRLRQRGYVRRERHPTVAAARS